MGIYGVLGCDRGMLFSPFLEFFREINIKKGIKMFPHPMLIVLMILR